MEIPDLTNLPITAVVLYALIIAAIDIATSIVAAIIRGDFSTDYLMAYIKNHVLLRVFPIAILGLLGAGLAFAQIPPIPAAGLAATGSLVAYIIETIGSISELRTSEPPRA
jgi:hypothetical protein